jgi:hypothetical protein
MTAPYITDARYPSSQTRGAQLAYELEKTPVLFWENVANCGYMATTHYWKLLKKMSVFKLFSDSWQPG